jgi:tetratricopeptide (TPR) repeat protein
MGYFELGRIYQMEQNPICIEYFTTAFALEPHDPEVRYQLAYAKQHFGQIDNAKVIYRKMVADTIDFYGAQALFQLGHIKQFVDGDFDSAKYFYAEATRRDTAYVEAWHNLGVCSDLTGDKERALRSFGKALKHSNQQFTLSRQYADSIM